MTEKHLPTMAWHPETGENQIFNHPGEVPSGWLDTHPDNKPKPAKAPAAAKEAAKTEAAKQLSLTRKEMLEALQAGGVEHDPKAKVEALDAVLRGAVEKALADAKIPYSPEAPTKELLALLPSPE
jgi:hypothetical protein